MEDINFMTLYEFERNLTEFLSTSFLNISRSLGLIIIVTYKNVVPHVSESVGADGEG